MDRAGGSREQAIGIDSDGETKEPSGGEPRNDTKARDQLQLITLR